MTMDALANFIVVAAEVLLVVFAVIGFVASCFAIGYLLHRELDEMRRLDDEV